MKAIIAEVVKETREISSFRLMPEAPMQYVAGQWMYVTLSQKAKGESLMLRHHFTISASPTESYLQFTTKFRAESEFKKTLWELKEGDEVELKGPFGSFMLEETDARPRIFIAGGIGITPFRSMMRYMADKKLNLPHTLLYSVKNRQDAAFVAELEPLGTKIIETEKEGRLNAEKIQSFCPDWQKSTVWLCGPPAMVESLVEIVQKLGVKAENTRSEEFTGY